MLDRPTRVVLAGCAAIAAVVVALALILGSGPEPPATGAAALVPADALMYVHLSTDPRRDGVNRAIALANRFPDYQRLSGAVEARLGALMNAPASGVRSWLGAEAAFALLNTTGSTAGSLIVLDVARPQRARRFLAAGRARPDGSYAGTALLRTPTGTELAFVSHYLVMGQRASVRAAIDVAGKRLPALSQSAAYRQASAGEPADRVLDAYASAGGVRRVLEPGTGAVGALGVLLDHPALTAVTISLSATDPGARLRIHEALDPTLAKLSGASPGGFSPSLPSELPAPGVLMFDVQDLASWAPRVLGAAGKAGVGSGVLPLLRRLGAALVGEGVNVHSLTGLFSGESAIAISPTVVPSGGRRSRPGTGRRGPALVIVTRTNDASSTSSQLASLESPLAQLFPPPASGPGVAPEFTEIPVDAVSVHQLRLAPGLDLDYAVFRGLVVVATSLPAMTEVIRPAEPLDQEPRYQVSLGDRPDPVTSLLFLDFSQLISLGEQTGLIGGRRVRALLPDLEKIRSIGLTSTRQESDSNAEVTLQIP